MLLKAFVANLKSSSPTIRRTAASSAVSICQHSRRTSYFYTWLLNVLLGRSHTGSLSSTDCGHVFSTLLHFTKLICVKICELIWNFCPFRLFPGLLVPVDDEHPSHLILGVLLTLRYLMPLLQQHVNSTSLKGSFGVMRKEADVQPTPEQLLQVRWNLCVCVYI